MLELTASNRITYLLKVFYQRLGTLGSVLNARVKGGPIYTLIKAFTQMMGDACEEANVLIAAYDIMNSSGAAHDQATGFFNRPRKAACKTEQIFTIMRTDATAALTVPAGASCQTVVLQSGSSYSYKILAADATTIEAGIYYALVAFQSLDIGSATAITEAQVLSWISGFTADECYVVGGAWDKSSANPLSDIGPDTIDTWLTNHISHFAASFRVEGIDRESDSAHLARCLGRWDEQATGSTADSYVSWATSYTDSDTGNMPVPKAQVTDNQVFSSSTGVAPDNQPLISGQEYIMGVEVAIAFSEGAIPSRADLLKIANYLYTLKPQTDKVWVRPPNVITIASSSTFLVVTYLGPTSLKAKVLKLVTSWFVYDKDYPDNYSGLGATVYKSDLIAAVRAFSSDIEDAKVVFTLPGKTDTDGNLVLDAFDQLAFASSSSSITVAVA